MSSNIYIYTDASFSPKFSKAVIGFAVISKHTELVTKAHVQMEFIDCKNCNRAELQSCIRALDSLTNLEGSKAITVYTDSQTIIGLNDRRKKLEERSFCSLRTKKPLQNADLYRELYRLNDTYSPHYIWVKGHMVKKEASLVNNNFSIVDQMVRKNLKQEIVQFNQKT